jgi:hypothetical protein
MAHSNPHYAEPKEHFRQETIIKPRRQLPTGFEVAEMSDALRVVRKEL